MKSGADFPAYIHDLKKLGVINYETFVADGHTDYYGAKNIKLTAPVKYDVLNIAPTSNTEQFKSDLLAHQQEKTDYPTFCNDCAKSGIEKSIVLLNKMTCTYFNQAGNEALVEQCRCEIFLHNY